MNGELYATAHPACRCNKIIVHVNAATPHFALWFKYDVTGWSDISSLWGMIILAIIKTDYWPSSNPCENEVGFIGTVLELSGTHFNGTFWDNHLIPINPNIGIIWY